MTAAQKAAKQVVNVMARVPEIQQTIPPKVMVIWDVTNKPVLIQYARKVR